MSKTDFKRIATDRIIDPERPLRTSMTPESVADLAASIKQVGIIEPLVVAKKGDNYEVIAGHRRLLAAIVVQLTEVPCLVVDTNALDAEMLKLHENLARSEINAVDWAKHLQYLKQHFGVDSAKIAEMMSVSEAWVSQHLEILNYSPELLTALETGMLSFSAARELAQIKDSRRREIYVHHAVRGGVTPRLAAQWRQEANRTPPNYSANSDEADTDIPTLDTSLTLPLCPVCQKPVEPEHHLTITIHDYCSPTAN